MELERAGLVKILQFVSAGLGKQGLGTCFAFVDGYVCAYNEDIACRAPCDIGWSGAVQAQKLLDILQKWTDSSVNIEYKDNHLCIYGGKTRRVKLVTESGLDLEVWQTAEPAEWLDVHPAFLDGIDAVRVAAGKGKDAEFLATCMHMTPNFIEASDTNQLARYKVKTGLKKPTLVPCDVMKHLVGLGVHKMGLIRGFLCFKNPIGVEAAVRTHSDEFPDLTYLLEDLADYEETALPGGMKEALETAKLFVGSDSEEQNVRVTLKQGQLILQAETAGIGEYTEKKKLPTYTGPTRRFAVNYKLLQAIAAHGKMIIAPLAAVPGCERLVVLEGRSIYLATTEVVEETNAAGEPA